MTDPTEPRTSPTDSRLLPFNCDLLFHNWSDRLRDHVASRPPLTPEGVAADAWVRVHPAPRNASALRNDGRRSNAVNFPRWRRVVLVVLDGVGYEQAMRNPEMGTLLRDKFHAQPMEAALPTMSAPNWLTILTGALPELTGFHGNIFSGETEFDSIFARHFDVQRHKAPA